MIFDFGRIFEVLQTPYAKRPMSILVGKNWKDPYNAV
jgi:hypothetical protein